MKQLTIEHLAAYLPYRLNVLQHDPSRRYPYKRDVWDRRVVDGTCENAVTVNESFSLETDWVDLSDIKLILRPLSQLTETITHNGETFVPYDVLEAHTLEGGRHRESLRYGCSAMTAATPEMWEITDPFKPYSHLPHWATKKLLSWHFDIFGLIDAGLAVPTNPDGTFTK